MSTSTPDRDTILRQIETWLLADQEALARTILERVAAREANGQSKPGPQTPPKISTWDALYGQASNGDEAPSDEQVAEWLDDLNERSPT